MSFRQIYILFVCLLGIYKLSLLAFQYHQQYLKDITYHNVLKDITITETPITNCVSSGIPKSLNGIYDKDEILLSKIK